MELRGGRGGAGLGIYCKKREAFYKMTNEFLGKKPSKKINLILDN